LNGSIYERELANLLSGKASNIEKFSKKLPPDSDKDLKSLLESPFYVTRAAGSLGADLIAVRHDVSLIIEVKSSQYDVIHFAESSGKRQEQADRLIEKCRLSGLFITYAYRLKNAPGDSWRLFSMPGEPVGRMKYVYNILPRADETKKGSYMLKWEKGIPLSKFVGYINFKIE
jgi:Holliday junction resolvase